jgi:hypothetical protein
MKYLSTFSSDCKICSAEQNSLSNFVGLSLGILYLSILLDGHPKIMCVKLFQNQSRGSRDVI